MAKINLFNWDMAFNVLMVYYKSYSNSTRLCTQKDIEFREEMRNGKFIFKKY